MIKETWTLDIGCHQKSVTSRDSATFDSFPPFFKNGEPLQSLEDCILCAKWHAVYWESSGYYVWYAAAIAPDGTRHKEIIPSVPY